MKYKNPEMEIVVFGQDVFTDLATSPENGEETTTGVPVPGDW